jgi:hypothetical protein
MLSKQAASDLEHGLGEWQNMQPVIRKAFKDSYDWLGTHQEAMEKLNHAFIKLSSKLENRVSSSEFKGMVDKQISASQKKSEKTLEAKTGEEIAKLSYELAKFNSLRAEVEKKVDKQHLQEELLLKVDKTDTSIKQLFGNIVTKNMNVMKEELEKLRSKELEETEAKVLTLNQELLDTKKKLADFDGLVNDFKEIKSKFELYPSYSAIHSMLDRKSDKSTLESALPQKMDQNAFQSTMATVERTLAEHEKSLMVLKLRAEMGADGQSRGYRGGAGEISPVHVNNSARGEADRFMMGFSAGGDDSILQVLPSRVSAGSSTTPAPPSSSSSSRGGVAPNAEVNESERLASDATHRAFNNAMKDIFSNKGRGEGSDTVTEPGRLESKLFSSRSDALLTAMWGRINGMHDEMRRLKDENVYLHNKLVQIDNTQYANHFDNIHRKKETDLAATRVGDAATRGGEQRPHETTALDNDLSLYATKAQVNELRDAVAAESTRVDTLLVHTALVQRADEDLQVLKNKLQDYDLALESLSSSRAAQEGKTSDLYTKMDQVNKKTSNFHNDLQKKVESCSASIAKLSVETMNEYAASLASLEKKLNEVDFESMRAHTLEGNQSERMRVRLEALERLAYSLETRIQAGMVESNEHHSHRMQQMQENQQHQTTTQANVSSIQGTPSRPPPHFHPGSFQERYQSRVGVRSSQTSSITNANVSTSSSPVKHRSNNPALDMRLARLQREKDELKRTLGLSFTSTGTSVLE